MTEWVDFKEVKSAISMEMVLEHYGIELRRVNQTSLRGKCPLPTHTGDSTNSFGVNTAKNAWACHAASCVANRDGRKGGNVLDFVAVMEGCAIRDAALKLQNWFYVAASNERPSNYVPSRDRRRSRTKRELATEKKEGSGDETRTDVQSDEGEAVNKPLGFALKSVDASHAYLTRRGLKQETAERFGVGFFHGHGSMEGRVVIPIHNDRGELIAYAGRAVDEETEPKYKLPAGFRKSLVLFNLHRVLKLESRGVVIVVEGFFDTMKVHQAGFPCVVGLMGSALSEHQENLLGAYFRNAVVMLDGDEGGRAASREIASRLGRKMFARVVSVPDGKQPDQLSSDELRRTLAFLREE